MSYEEVAGGQGQGRKLQCSHSLEGGEVEPHTAELYILSPVQSQRVSPIQVKMRVNSVVDTVAALSVISEQTYQKMWPHGAPELEPSTVSYLIQGGWEGSLCKDQHECLPLLVVRTGCLFSSRSAVRKPT